MLLDATTAVMRRNAYASATVQDILAEAGLSTRSFYRHFQSKDDLLKAIYRRDAERAARNLADRVAAAATPRGALEAWIDELLSFGYDARRARRVAMIRAELTRRARGSDEEEQYATAVMTEPLIATLRAGKKDGTFPATVPERDALAIHALTSQAWSWALDGRFGLSRQAALDHVLRFCLPALGWREQRESTAE